MLSTPRSVRLGAGRASEGDALPVAQYAAGKAGVPSRLLAPKLALLAAAPLGTTRSRH